jgi:hypothetical protein
MVYIIYAAKNRHPRTDNAKLNHGEDDKHCDELNHGGTANTAKDTKIVLV